MDTVLGVSMAPKTVRMVLVEGENADGVTVDEEKFDLPDGQEAANGSGTDQVISAILGTQEGAAANGYQLMSTGVVWTDPVEAAALRDALARHKMENVMLVSAFLAAAALAQEVGSATGYDQTALLFVEPDAATLAMVDSADGSIVDVRRQTLQGTDRAAELAALVSATTQAMPTPPAGLFVVGNGVDIAPIKPALEAATSLIVSVPEEPETALARGAALASANAPLFSSSTAAMAWAQDPGTGAFDAHGAAARYADAPVAGGEEGLAYSAIADDDANAETAMAPQDDVDFGTGAYPDFVDEEPKPRRRPLWVAASAAAAFLVIGAVALVIALAIGVRPHVGTRPQPGSNIVAPASPAPAPNAPPPGAPAPASAPAPAPQAPASPAPAAPAPAAPAPAAPAPAPAAPAPEAPPPVQEAPAPEAPAPAPAAPPAVPQVPVPIPVPIPVGPPGGGPGGGGGGGGIPGIPGLPGGGGRGGEGPGGGHGGFPGGGGHGGGGPGGFHGF